MNRTEHELRAALDLAADDHPSAADVLTNRRSHRLRMALPIAAAAAVVLAAGIPVLLLSHNQTARSSPAVAAVGVTSAPFSGAAGGPTGATAITPAPAQSCAANEACPAPAPITSFPSAGHTCRPNEVAVSLSWGPVSSTINGTLSVKNKSAGPCDLLLKPDITIIGTDGKPLTEVNSAEGRAGPSRLMPGATATAPIWWSGWCGVTLGDPVKVSWGTGDVSVTPTGTHASSGCANASTGGSLSTGWFDPLS
jgi:hypothetical protein